MLNGTEVSGRMEGRLSDGRRKGGGVKGIYGKIVTFYRSGNKYSIIENKNSKIPIIF